MKRKGGMDKGREGERDERETRETRKGGRQKKNRER
jgi:hypothetical protein